MSGVPGRGGPPPKRSSERRRRNKVDIDTVKMAGEVDIPDVDPTWDPIAVDWYKSLGDSGQSKYFEPSDWAAARFVAHEMSRHLRNRRPSSEWFKGIWAAMNDLLTTEAHRRRVRMEVDRDRDRDKPGTADESSKVSRLDDYRAL